jgi:hypothetical protein
MSEKEYLMAHSSNKLNEWLTNILLGRNRGDCRKSLLFMSLKDRKTFRLCNSKQGKDNMGALTRGLSGLFITEGFSVAFEVGS